MEVAGAADEDDLIAAANWGLVDSKGIPLPRAVFPFALYAASAAMPDERLGCCVKGGGGG